MFKVFFKDLKFWGWETCRGGRREWLREKMEDLHGAMRR